jgi:hypothetical protein
VKTCGVVMKVQFARKVTSSWSSTAQDMENVVQPKSKEIQNISITKATHNVNGKNGDAMITSIHMVIVDSMSWFAWTMHQWKNPMEEVYPCVQRECH